MAKRSETITHESLDGLLRHHPYLLIFQKEDWRDYLVLLADIYDLLEEQTARVSVDVVRSAAMRFFSVKGLAFPEQKVGQFLTMAIGELQVLKDSHDQFGQRFVETTRAGKGLLQMIEGLVAQRSKFSGTGAETLLGSLNDILIGRRQMTANEALAHHRSKIAAFREDMARIKDEGLAAAQLLPLAHSNEALLSQAEEAAIHVLDSIEDVKSAIEEQRQELAAGYFQSRRSAGATLEEVADFYEGLYQSSAYASYVQAKELLSHLEGFQARFTMRNVDRLLHSIESRELVAEDLIKKSNLRAFMHQFEVADASIQEKIKAQLKILQQQVLYAIATDVEGLRAGLHDVLSKFLAEPDRVEGFWTSEALAIPLREDIQPGPVELFDFELPVTIVPQVLEEESFDHEQERALLLALVRAEEGTLKDILHRLTAYLRKHGELRAEEHEFPNGLAEYYVLSEIELFDPKIERLERDVTDLKLRSKYGSYVVRRVPAFTLRSREWKN
ncbi:MAG: hypothetical protein NDI61_04385 [Bdellovibrionaceae bacterium]|nr:hypothetical protein [Pseudobdellovibrionaceae bacterium]